jgi:transglutaminase/protease-like cytokinesis protein 3
MDENIAKEAIDSFTASDVLRERRAECQGHAYLFAALARASGIPTRIVNGIVYAAEHGGFLYHTWNESWIAERGWQPVDATFGQVHADATHLKLIEGELAGDLVPLVGLVGRIKVSSVSARAQP